MSAVLHVVQGMQGGMLTHLRTLLAGLAERGVACAVAGPAGLWPGLGSQPSVPLAAGSVRSLAALRRAVALRQPGLVHAHGLRASVLAAAALAALRPSRRCPLVCSIHGPLPPAGSPWRRPWHTAAVRWALERADAVLAVSRSLSGELSAWLGPWAAAPQRVTVVPNGVLLSGGAGCGCSRCARLSGRRRAGASCPVATCMARLVPVKGVDLLLEAAVRVAPGVPLRVWVAGDGPQRAELARQARRLGLAGRLRFLGACSHPAAVWARSDLAVLPSRAEGLPYAALEAMAWGRAVVAFAVGGLV
ncbi:MAG TPA: glycosyltransferase family 4 protein, partial [Limnochordales bacterium]